MNNKQRISRRKFVGGIAALGATALPQQAGNIRGFDHVALPMQNTDAMLAFYRALGLQMVENQQAVSVYIGTQMINFHLPRRLAARNVHAANSGCEAAMRRPVLRLGRNSRCAQSAVESRWRQD